MEKSNRTGLALTKLLIKVLFLFYILLLVGSLIALVFFLRGYGEIEETKKIHLWVCLLGSFLSAILGSTIYYSRKIYKLCINGELEINSSIGAREAGTALYFFTRPIFSCAFAFLIVISLKAENQFVSMSGQVDSYNFIFVSMFISFLSGFSAGKVITILEKRGAPIRE